MKSVYCLALIIFVVSFSAEAQVTFADDSGPGTLRAVVSGAVAGTTITFDPSLSGKAIHLTSGEIVVNKALTITSSGLPEGIAISGSELSRVFRVSSTGTLTLLDVTIQAGEVGTGEDGGGIRVASSGSLLMDGCTISDCRATSGGAIWNEGSLNLKRTTLANNHATDSGGAISNRASGSTTLDQCTLSANMASTSSGGIAFIPGTLQVENSIIAGNTAPSDPDLNRLPTSTVGTNIVGGAPMLAPLGHYGGPTQTMHPLVNSPAIDTAGTTDPGGTDQRGFSRFVGGALDIGAVELGPVTLVNLTADSVSGSTTLRNAIADASDTAGGTIHFASSLSGQTIRLTQGDLVIPGTANGLIIDASDLVPALTIEANVGPTQWRVMTIFQGATVALHGLTLTGGDLFGQTGTGGGCIYNEKATLTLSHCRLSNNRAFVGGAIYNGGEGATASLALHACDLSDNAATSGGGIFSDGQANGHATLKLCQSTFSNNSASSSGGGIYSYGSRGMASLYLDDCTISDNSARFGGGISASGRSNGTSISILNGCTIAKNTARNNGGGILNVGSDGMGTLELRACTLTGNQADFGGGVFDDSRSDGITVMAFANTIIAGNGATESGPDMYRTSAAATLRVLGKNIMSTVNGAGLADATNLFIYPISVLNLAPLGDYGGLTKTMLPLLGSPAIDKAGTVATTSFDQRGFARLVGGSLDIGAVESQGNEDLARIWSSDWDGDGHPYGMEFALGTDAFVSDAGNEANPNMVVNASGQRVITFAHQPDANPYTEWVLKRSTDLVHYDIELYRFDGINEVFSQGATGDGLTSGVFEVIDTSIPGENRYFYRFEAESP